MIYKCSRCGGALLFDPERGCLRCSQCGQYEKGRMRIKLADDTEEADGDDRNDRNRSDFESLWFGLAKDQKWHGEEEIEVNPAWDADIVAEENQKTMRDLDEDTSYMSVNIYKCTSCGARLMLDRNESATFCSHCGNPTVVFDRVSDEAAPDYIIPFQITEEQAVDLIKKRFGKGFLIPDEIKNPQIDKIRGIYVPYWLYTVYIRKKANLKTVDRDDARHNVRQYQRWKKYGSFTKGMYPGSLSDQKHNEMLLTDTGNILGDKYVDCYATFERIGTDASSRLDNNLARALEPYHMEALQDFDPKLLSGFYADRYDVGSRDAAPHIYKKITETVNRTILADTETDEIGREIEQYSVNSIEYALLPVWFMTFWYRHKLYTVLVNGQTGKVVGNIPVRRDRLIMSSLVLTTFISMISVFATVTLGRYISDGSVDLISESLNVFAILIALAVVYGIRGYSRYIRYRTGRNKLSSMVTTGYVRERQDRTWVR